MMDCQKGNRRRCLPLLLCLLAVFLAMNMMEGTGEARKAKSTADPSPRTKTILFVPQDNRPTSREQSAEAVEKLGYRVLMPPRELLGGLGAGKPEELWEWTAVQAARADAAVISTDAFLYGGLVASRKHELSEQVLSERVQRLASLKQRNQRLKVYAFGSLMRTPASGPASGGEEPAYYLTYGAQIFRRSGLLDKQENGGLTAAEDRELQTLAGLIPDDVWQDWTQRRAKNFAVDQALIDLSRTGQIDYFVLGKDDNAPLSATHAESLRLARYAQDVPGARFQMLAGIDEFAALLMARAVNDQDHVVPFVNVQYNWGVGGAMVPDYSDEPIAASIQSDLLIAGAVAVPDPARADLVLLVNTPPDGKMGYGNAPDNDGVDLYDAQSFVCYAGSLIAQGYRVAIADITRTNGADNALMNGLRDAGLLFRLYGYAGWNTATNSVGFVLGQGILNVRLPEKDVDALLLERYLDDWGYQSNVRTMVSNQLSMLSRPDILLNLGRYEPAAQLRVTRLLREFAASNLPPYPGVDHLEFYFPWHRMFIGGIVLPRG